MRVLCSLVLAFGLLLSGRASIVPLHCWLVAYDSGVGRVEMEAVSNLVSRVNDLYSQVVMEFKITSVSYTNSTYFADIDLTNVTQFVELCSLSRGTDGLELYFVPSLLGGTTAFQFSDGIIIGPRANERTVAHEIGHACGLDDIYDASDDDSLTVTGAPTRARMPNDWGWYPPDIMQSDVIRRLLMYGIQSNSKADISYGDIYGAYYTSEWNQDTNAWEGHWRLDKVPVGFGLHGNRNPVSQ